MTEDGATKVNWVIVSGPWPSVYGDHSDPQTDSWGPPELQWHLWLCCTNRREKHHCHVGWELCVFVMVHHGLLSPDSSGWIDLSVCNFDFVCVETCDVVNAGLAVTITNAYCSNIYYNYCAEYSIPMIDVTVFLFLLHFYLFHCRWKDTWWKAHPSSKCSLDSFKSFGLCFSCDYLFIFCIKVLLHIGRSHLLLYFSKSELLPL